MLNKKAWAVQMTYDISTEEKARAEQSLLAFKYLNKKLDACLDHLNILYVPFKDHEDIGPEQTVKYRVALRRFRDKVADNFNEAKEICFKCYLFLNSFSSDTQIVKLIKSYVSGIGDLEKQVNRFLDLFGDLSSNEFRNNAVVSIDAIKKEVLQLQQILEDRVIQHIQENILAKTWVDNVSDKLQVNVETKVPYMSELFEDRQKELNDKKDE